MFLAKDIHFCKGSWSYVLLIFFVLGKTTAERCINMIYYII